MIMLHIHHRDLDQLIFFETNTSAAITKDLYIEKYMLKRNIVTKSTEKGVFFIKFFNLLMKRELDAPYRVLVRLGFRTDFLFILFQDAPDTEKRFNVVVISRAW